MSEFKYVYGENLQHWGKGKQADDYKYTAREWVKGKWKYIYDTGKKATDKAKSTVEDVNKSARTNARLAKNTINNTLGINQRKKAENLKSIYKDSEAKAGAAKDAYEKNRYTDAKYYADVKNRGYDINKNQRAEAVKALKEQIAEKNLDREFKKEYEDAISAPESGADYRYFSSKLLSDESRQKRAEEMQKKAIKSKNDYEKAQAEYDKTLLGKVEKAPETIKGAFGSIKDKISDASQKAIDKFNDITSKSKETIKDTAKDASSKANDAKSKLADKYSDTVNKIEKNVQNVTSNLTKGDKEKIGFANALTPKEVKNTFGDMSDYFDPVASIELLDFINESTDGNGILISMLVLSGTIVPVLLGLDLMEAAYETYENIKDRADLKDKENTAKYLEAQNRIREAELKEDVLSDLKYDEDERKKYFYNYGKGKKK